MKTLSRKEILHYLENREAFALVVNLIDQRVFVVINDSGSEVVGAVRFDTYLKLCKEKVISKVSQKYLTEVYALAA